MLEAAAIEDRVRAQFHRLTGACRAWVAGEENHRCKAWPAHRIAQPVKPAPAGTAARDQHSIKALGEKLRRERALHARTVDREACLGPAAAGVMLDERR